MIQAVGDSLNKQCVRLIFSEKAWPSSLYNWGQSGLPSDLGQVYSDQMVCLGQDALVMRPDGNKFGSNTRLTLVDKDQNNVLMSIEVHTSCSQPLLTNDRFGALVLRGAVYGDDNNQDTYFCAPPGPGPSPTPTTTPAPTAAPDCDTVDICELGDKNDIFKLLLRYVGGSAADSMNAQGDKAKVRGREGERERGREGERERRREGEDEREHDRLQGDGRWQLDTCPYVCCALCRRLGTA